MGEEDLDEDDEGKVSRRMGCWWLTTRKTPVDMLRARGTAWRRRAPRQRVMVAIVLGRCLVGLKVYFGGGGV